MIPTSANLDHMLRMVTNDGSIASHYGMDVNLVRAARAVLKPAAVNQRFQATRQESANYSSGINDEFVSRAAATKGSAKLLNKCLDLIDAFASKHCITFAEAEILILDTGVRLRG